MRCKGSGETEGSDAEATDTLLTSFLRKGAGMTLELRVAEALARRQEDARADPELICRSQCTSAPLCR